MDMNQYLDIFIEETKEHLQSMNDILLKMESSSYDKDLLNEMFRVAHTIKGMSGTMGFNNVAGLTHEMENLMDLIRTGKMEVNSDIIDVLFQCFDQLEEYTVQVEEQGKDGENISEELIIKLKEIMGAKPAKKEEKLEEEKSSIDQHVLKAVEKSTKEGMNVYLLKVKLDEKCMLKSARAYILLNRLEQFGEIIHASPSVEDIEDEKFELEFELVIVTNDESDYISENLNDISEIDSIDFIKLDEKFIESESIKTDDSEVDEEIESQIEDKKDISKEDKKDESKKAKAKTGKTVRVDIDRLDNLMNLVSELIIIKTRLEDAEESKKDGKINDTTEYLERITTSLHDAVMKVRMVPIERVFNRFPRMVRDVAKDLGKEINLEMSGKETEVDRTVIDEIGDPLIHLIRNSIDHGIESPENRVEKGKDKAGTVRLAAYPDGNSVVIEVEDDGGGIDVEKVKNKAISKGLITEEQASVMDQSESINILFMPGFSTADKVSDLSGRGVGLDVVKTKIESLGGDIELTSKLNRGSKSVIRLPLTLAIIQALLVKVGKEKYAVPLNTIKEITTIDGSKIRKIQGNDVTLYREETLPILKLGDLLAVDEYKSKDVLSKEETVVIVKKGEKSVGIIVDDLIGQQEIVIKSLGKFLNNIKGIAGATILGNGTVALIVDSNSYFKEVNK